MTWRRAGYDMRQLPHTKKPPGLSVRLISVKMAFSSGLPVRANEASGQACADGLVQSPYLDVRVRQYYRPIIGSGSVVLWCTRAHEHEHAHHSTTLTRT